MKEKNKVVEQHYKDNFVRYCKIANKSFGGRYDVAEDAVQDSYLRAIQYYDCFNPELRDFNVWFNTIFNNCVRDLKRQEKNRNEVENTDRSVFKPQDITEDIRNDISRFIQSDFTNPKKEVLYFYYERGLTPKEISMLMERMSVSNVWQILSRFKKEFISKYKDERNSI